MRQRVILPIFGYIQCSHLKFVEWYVQFAGIIIMLSHVLLRHITIIEAFINTNNK